MRTNLVATIGAIGLLGLSGAVISGQQRGRGGAPAAPVPDLATSKTMYWAASDIQARWKEDEALQRINSRIFNGPTNISANVRIVLANDPPLTHDTTADLWIVTEGTATARTDGKMAADGKTIDSATERNVQPGDVLYIPPGVPHHFANRKDFRAWLIRFDTKGLVRTKPVPPPEGGGPAAGRGAAPAGAGGAAPAARQGGGQAARVPDLATDKTMFWAAADIESRWKENEATKRANSRIYNGPANISANVRIVLPDDPPLTHTETADLWIVTGGEAVAATDGELVTEGKTSTIRNPTMRPMHVGDVLYVPPGVAHHFTDMKGFRAWLIRFDVEGWAQSIPAPAGGAR